MDTYKAVGVTVRIQPQGSEFWYHFASAKTPEAASIIASVMNRREKDILRRRNDRRSNVKTESDLQEVA